MGDAVVYYREPLATKEMRYARLSHRAKICKIKSYSWMSPLVYYRNLNPLSLNAYHYSFRHPFGMFFMQF